MYNILAGKANASLKRIRLHFLCFAFKCLGMTGFLPSQPSWETSSPAASLWVSCQSKATPHVPSLWWSWADVANRKPVTTNKTC